VQISSLLSSPPLTTHLRTCPRHVSRAEWPRHSMSTKKVRRILSEGAYRHPLQVVRFEQVASAPGLKVSTGGAGAAAHVGASRLQINPHESFYRNGK
jgi:hypothetical protein